jgi:hypothetical protein
MPVYRTVEERVDAILDAIWPRQRTERPPCEPLESPPKNLRTKGATTTRKKRKSRREIAPERLNQLTREQRVQGLSLEQRLAGVPAEEIEASLKRLAKQPATPRRKKRKPRL